jgi:hypothetical protein
VGMPLRRAAPSDRLTRQPLRHTLGAARPRCIPTQRVGTRRGPHTETRRHGERQTPASVPAGDITASTSTGSPCPVTYLGPKLRLGPQVLQALPAVPSPAQRRPRQGHATGSRASHPSAPKRSLGARKQPDGPQHPVSLPPPPLVPTRCVGMPLRRAAPSDRLVAPRNGATKDQEILREMRS